MLLFDNSSTSVDLTYIESELDDILLEVSSIYDHLQEQETAEQLEPESESSVGLDQVLETLDQTNNMLYFNFGIYGVIAGLIVILILVKKFGR